VIYLKLFIKGDLYRCSRAFDVTICREFGGGNAAIIEAKLIECLQSRNWRARGKEDDDVTNENSIYSLCAFLWRRSFFHANDFKYRRVKEALSNFQIVVIAQPPPLPPPDCCKNFLEGKTWIKLRFFRDEQRWREICHGEKLLWGEGGRENDRVRCGT
jgi:hypothetical protein